MNNKKKTPVAVVEGHSIARKGLIDYVGSWDEFIVVLEVSDGRMLLENIEQALQFPEICILSTNMQVPDSYETCQEIKKRWPSLKILILSLHAPEFIVIKMISLGANGFLSEDCSPDDIHEALTSIHNEGYYYSQFISENIFRKAQDSGLLKLTDREIEFLNLCCTDMPYKNIADKMGISIRTIESYRDSLYKKLNIKTRIGLMLFALKTGIVPQEKL